MPKDELLRDTIAAIATPPGRGGIGIVRLSGPAVAPIAQRIIGALPVAQREVITLRDIEGRSAAEVCNTLGLTETNQRVLLHRARSRVRAVLEPYLAEQA